MGICTEITLQLLKMEDGKEEATHCSTSNEVFVCLCGCIENHTEDHPFDLRPTTLYTDLGKQQSTVLFRTEHFSLRTN